MKDVESVLLAGVDRKNSLIKQLLEGFISGLVCLVWMVVSSSAILVNRHIMVVLKFKYPCALSWMGLATTMLLSSISCVFLPPHKRTKFNGKEFLRTSMPTGLFMALTFQMGNTGYMYLTVAFVQMLKALCPVVTMTLLFIARLELFSRRLVVAVVAITVGVTLASYGELNLSLIGVSAMLASVLFESIRLVLIQYILVDSKCHPLEGLKLISTACTLWLCLQVSMLELPEILAQKKYLILRDNPGYVAMGCVAGFGVNLSAILVIKQCSSLTLKVVGTLKDTMLIAYGILIFHEQVTRLQLAGYFTSMVAFVYYNYLKAFETPGYASPQSEAGNRRIKGV